MNYGLLGCGMMGREHLKNLALLEDARVIAIAEPDAEMQRLAAALAPGAQMLRTLDELLAVKELDALVIATPNYQHADQLLTILQQTSLPILVEKPLVTEPADIPRIQEAAARHPAPIWVAMEYRYMPPLQKFLNLLSDGAVGNLKTLSIREHRFPFLKKVNDWNRFNRNSGGTLVEKCCHYFDLMRLIVNDEASRVYASAGQDCNHLTENYGGETPDILDNAFVIVDFTSGRRAMLDLNMFAEGSTYQEEICVIGHLGKLECLIPGPERIWPTETLGSSPIPTVIISPRRPKMPKEVPVPVDQKLLAAGDHQGSTYYEHLGFFNCIAQGGPVEVTVEDGLKAVAIGMAAQHSAASGQAVTMSTDGLGFVVE